MTSSLMGQRLRRTLMFLSLGMGDSERVYLLVSQPCRPETQNGVSAIVSLDGRLRRSVLVAVSPVVEDSEQVVSVGVSPLTGPRLRTQVDLLLSHWTRRSQKKECLLGRYLYLFPMRRRLQSGASPFAGCDWLFPSEWGDTVWPTLLSSNGTYLNSPNTHLEKCH